MKIHFGLRGWQAWTSDPAANTPQLIPANLRRRSTPQGQHALEAVWNLPEIDTARYILSSRHGEMSRTLSLLQSLSDREELSPADFTLSVHNALIGLLSIARKNAHGHTALAAGEESFSMGLVEAAACLVAQPREPVILIHFDDLLPAPYADFEEGKKPVALALVLCAPYEGSSIKVEALAPSAALSPGSEAQSFLDFLTGNLQEDIFTGTRRAWRWSRM